MERTEISGEKVEVTTTEETNRTTVDLVAETWKSREVTETFWVLQWSYNDEWTDVLWNTGYPGNPPDITIKVIDTYLTAGPSYLGAAQALISREEQSAIFALHSIYRGGSGGVNWRIIKRSVTINIHDDTKVNTDLTLRKTW